MSVTTRKLMFLSSFVLGLNTSGHFALFCLDSGNLIQLIILPILSGYLELVLQAPQGHIVFQFLKHKPHKPMRASDPLMFLYGAET